MTTSVLVIAVSVVVIIYDLALIRHLNREQERLDQRIAELERFLL